MRSSPEDRSRTVGGDDATPGVKTVGVRDTVNVAGAFSHFLRSKITY